MSVTRWPSWASASHAGQKRDAIAQTSRGGPKHPECHAMPRASCDGPEHHAMAQSGTRWPRAAHKLENIFTFRRFLPLAGCHGHLKRRGLCHKTSEKTREGLRGREVETRERGLHTSAGTENCKAQKFSCVRCIFVVLVCNCIRVCLTLGVVGDLGIGSIRSWDRIRPILGWDRINPKKLCPG